MSRPALSSLALAFAVLGAACAEPPERLTAVPGPPDPPSTTTCDAVVTGVAPEGTLPAARTALVTVAFSGHALAGQVKVRVSGPEGPVPGALLLGDGVIEVRADAPYLPGQHLIEASVCDSHVVRAFEVGAVHHALAADDWAALAGRQLGLDLRYGAWIEPAPREGRELILRNLFAGALVLDVVSASDHGIVGAVAPAQLAADGTVVAASSALLPAPLSVANPYALASFDRLELSADGHAFSLRDGALVLGFTEDGVTDARLSSEVDMRDFGALGDSTACDALAAHSFGSCQPCTSDGEPYCFALTLEGLASQR